MLLRKELKENVADVESTPWKSETSSCVRARRITQEITLSRRVVNGVIKREPEGSKMTITSQRHLCCRQYIEYCFLAILALFLHISQWPELTFFVFGQDFA